MTLSYIRLRRILPISPPFPYTTLFRSTDASRCAFELGKCRSTRTLHRLHQIGDEISMAIKRIAGCGQDRQVHTDLRQPPIVFQRSEEHTSELQSRENLVCRFLLEKKNR